MEIKVLSYNIQSWDVTERRINGIIDLIKRHNPDVILLQEVTVLWYKILRKAFSNVYEINGRDRLYGDKDCLRRDREKNCVLYKKNRFKLLNARTYWLGPDMLNPSKFEDSVFKRVFTAAKLLDLKNNRKFLAISTHFDYLKPECREKQAQVLANYLKTQKLPIVLAGDFNGDPTEDFYKTMTDVVIDIGAEFNENNITYHAYNEFEHMRIDYIFRSKDVIATSFALVKDDYEGLPPSDHYPVEATIKIK